MGRRVLSIAVACVLAACGGTPFTVTIDDASVPDDATGDSAADGSNTGDGAPSDAGSSDARDDAVRLDGAADGAPVIPCHVLTNAGCPDNMYCASPACGGGICTQKPSGDDTANTVAVCGCDGITYYNDSVAHRHGMAVKSVGQCGIDGKACTVIAPACPNGSTCNLGQQSLNVCSGTAPLPGSCWVMPEQCPTEPQARDCASNQCVDQCDLVKNSKLWAADSRCP
jgi:hypothetical protein